MKPPPRDVTELYMKAKSAALRVDFKRQYNIPDLERLLVSAYVHGFTDGVDSTKSEGEKHGN